MLKSSRDKLAPTVGEAAQLPAVSLGENPAGPCAALSLTVPAPVGASLLASSSWRAEKLASKLAPTVGEAAQFPAVSRGENPAGPCAALFLTAPAPVGASLLASSSWRAEKLARQARSYSTCGSSTSSRVARRKSSRPMRCATPDRPDPVGASLLASSSCHVRDGSSITNRVTPSCDSHLICPPWARMIDWVMASPSPACSLLPSRRAGSAR